MPYILPEKRLALDAAIDELHHCLVGLELDDEENNMEGNLNYAITKLLRKVYDQSYRSVNDAMGMLTCVMFEHYRTMAAPYEDQKKFENGDVEIAHQVTSVGEVVVTKKVPEDLGQIVGFEE